MLLEAARILRDRARGVAVDFIGEGPLEAELRQAITDARLNDLVHLRGPQSPTEVRDSLSEADVFCLPSFAEGLPVAIMEAMAIGVPVVASCVGGIPEIAADGRTALVVAPGNANRLADAIDRMVSDVDLRASIIEEARRFVVCRHDLERNAGELAEVFASGGRQL